MLKKCRGSNLAKKIVEFCEEQSVNNGYNSVRVDTHKDNKAMRGLLKKCGYSYCGVVYLTDAGHETGAPRVAYEKILRRK